jgi:hypothetical protein
MAAASNGVSVFVDTHTWRVCKLPAFSSENSVPSVGVKVKHKKNGND